MKAKLLSFFLAAILLGLTACNVDDNPITGGSSDFVDGYDYEGVKCELPVFVSYGIPQNVRTALESYLTNITSIDEAEIAVVRAEDLGTYEGKLIDVYNRGGLVVITNPTTELYDAFAEKLNEQGILPTESSQETILFAINNRNHSYALHGTELPEDATEEQIADYYKNRIYHLFRWYKEQPKPNASRAASTRGEVSPTLILNEFDAKVVLNNCQVLTNNFIISLSHEMYNDVGINEPAERLDETGAVESTYYIFPVYLYEINDDKAGDYYFVKGGVTVYNGAVWEPRLTEHGVVRYDLLIAGYYMSSLDVVASLLTRDPYNDNALGCLFAKNPKPQSTKNATSYSEEIEFGVEGSLNAGVSTFVGGGVGFSASSKEAISQTLEDIQVEHNTGPTTRWVEHKYIVKNIGFEAGAGARNQYNNRNKHVPAAARTNFVTETFWGWHMPTGKYGVRDNSDSTLIFKVDIDVIYMCFVESNRDCWINNFKSFDDGKGIKFKQTIKAPNRVPFGVVSLENYHPNPINHINIWKTDEHPGKGDPYAQLNTTGIGANASAKCALLEGKYYIEYQQIKADNDSVLSTWAIDNIEVKKGLTEAASTTKVSTLNAKQISK